MPFENSSGIGVNNFYGPRDAGGSVGVERSTDSIHQMSIEFTDQTLNGTFLPPFVLPQGAKILRYLLRVDQAFNITGTSPTIIFGGTAPATNGVVLTEAELETVGTKIPASTGTGTWAVGSTTGTTASEKVTFTKGGTSPVVVTGVGQATLIAEYVYKNRTVS